MQEVEEDGITVKPDTQEVYIAKNIAIATGHHAKPTVAKFMGQDSFTGLIIGLFIISYTWQLDKRI